jgi:hypothetical protein
MKLLTLLIIILILNMNPYANAQSVLAPKDYSNDSLMLRAKKLKQLYLLSTSSSVDLGNIYKEKFFNEFPTTFKGLNELYGDDYDIHHKPAILIDQAEKHINLFNELNTINDTLYYHKIISIAIDGRWDSDAVNFFQHGLKIKVLNNPALVVNILKNMPNDKIRSFWYFYFDGAHPKKQIAEPLQKIKSMNNKIFDLMIKAQNDVLKYSKE